MQISAKKINQILVRYGYKLVMDQLHDDSEIEKYGRFEKNFNKKKYLTIKNKTSFVIGRIYQYNSNKDISLDEIILNQQGIDTILAFFKYFEITDSKKVINELKKISGIDNLQSIKVDLIRNNVFKQEAY